MSHKKHPKKHSKKIIAKSSGPDYVAELKEKAKQISAQEKQLAGMDPIGWLNGEAIKLMGEIDQNIQEYKNIKAEGIVHPPPAGASTEDKKKYGYTYFFVPELESYKKLGIPEVNAHFAIAQGILEKGHIPVTEKQKEAQQKYVLYGQKAKPGEPYIVLPTKEDVPRIIKGVKKIVTIDTVGNFKTYPSIDSAVSDHINVLKRTYPKTYENLIDTSAGAETYYYNLQHGKYHYATGTNYVNDLKKTYNSEKKDLPRFKDANLIYTDSLITQLEKNAAQTKATPAGMKAFTNNDAPQKNTSNTDILAFLMGHGIPGDSDYVPSFFDADKYTFNGPSGKWTPKSEDTLQEQGVDLNSIEFQYLKKYNTFPKATNGNIKSKTPVHSPAPAKHSKTPTPTPKQKVTGTHPTGFNITIKKVIGQMVGTQEVSSGESKPLTGDVVAGLLRNAVQSNMV